MAEKGGCSCFMTAPACLARTCFAEESHLKHLILFVWMGVQFLPHYSVGKTSLKLIKKTFSLVILHGLKKISTFDL